MLSSPTFKTVDWNSQINDIFALTPAKPKPKTSKKKCTKIWQMESILARTVLVWFSSIGFAKRFQNK
jgi:hypothetical protein